MKTVPESLLTLFRIREWAEEVSRQVVWTDGSPDMLDRARKEEDCLNTFRNIRGKRMLHSLPCSLRD